jgi:uncharacterized protein (DUF983 family)
MAFSDSAFGAVVTCKCPRCRKGDMFTNKNPYVFSEMAKMPKNCKVCGQRLEPETGFYYGAMYLSYAMGVFSSLIFFAILNFAFHIPTTYAFIIVAGVWLIGSPYLFRFSRALWLSLYVNRHRDI